MVALQFQQEGHKPGAREDVQGLRRGGGRFHARHGRVHERPWSPTYLPFVRRPASDLVRVADLCLDYQISKRSGPVIMLYAPTLAELTNKGEDEDRCNWQR